MIHVLSVAAMVLSSSVYGPMPQDREIGRLHSLICDFRQQDGPKISVMLSMRAQSWAERLEREGGLRHDFGHNFPEIIGTAPSPDFIFDAWHDSPPHWGVLLKSQMVGYGKSGIFWVAIMPSRRIPSEELQADGP